MTCIDDRTTQMAVRDLRKLQENLESKYGISLRDRSKGIFVEQEMNSNDLAKAVNNVQFSVSEALAKMQEEIRLKDRELASIRATSSSSYASTVSRLSSPFRGGGPPERTVATATVESLSPSAGMVTPVKQQSDRPSDMASWSNAIRSAIKTSSPSASGAARLHAELVKEVSLHWLIVEEWL